MEEEPHVEQFSNIQQKFVFYLVAPFQFFEAFKRDHWIGLSVV